MAVDDDDLLADGDHPGGSIDLVNGQAEGLALAEPGPRAEQDQQRIPARHSGGQGEYLGGRQQPDDCRGDLRQANIVARCLTEIAVPDGPAQNAREYDVNGFYRAWGKSLDCLQVLNPLLDHGRFYGRQAILPEYRDNVILEMPFVSVDCS